MRIIRPRIDLLLLFAAIFALSACQPVRTDPVIPFQLDAGGLQLTDSPLRIDFGRTDHSTIPAMTKLMGRGPDQSYECKAGLGTMVAWANGPGLIFQNGDFRGWMSADSAGNQMSAGLTCD